MSKLSLKKNTPVVLAKILNPLMIKKRKNCFRICPFRFRKAQLRPRKKLQLAPQQAPRLVDVT
jgi:hypothetical protein